MGSSSVIGLVLVLVVHLVQSKLEPRFSPYIDVTREEEFKLVQLKQKHGITSVSLAFALGGIKGECSPSWAGQLPIDHSYIIEEIAAYNVAGGQIIVSTGGQGGPYIETSCTTAGSLEAAYERVITLTGAKHLDIDIEAAVPSDLMNHALAAVQRNHPGLTVSFTLGVMDEDYGINVNLGIANVKNAVQHGVVVDIVNPMAMDFINRMPSFGDAVVAVSKKSVEQMKDVWPEKSEKELYSMLGVTPMIGLNDNLKVFELAHAKQLVDWAKAAGVGHLGFWSLGRDKACAGNAALVDPGCSGIAQSDWAFTEIFLKFQDDSYQPTIAPTHAPTLSPTDGPTPSRGPRSTVPVPAMDCSTPGTKYPDPNDCNWYYECVNDAPLHEVCPSSTIWDTTKQICNYPKDANRPECL